MVPGSLNSALSSTRGAAAEALDMFHDLRAAEAKAASLRNRRAELNAEMTKVRAQLADEERRVSDLVHRIDETLGRASGRPEAALAPEAAPEDAA
ncbi:MAG: hypothetical protein VYD87_04410 [Pseudomonadota bacterium]|nr:hypothetical protein [Pseudomonadota bacterium]MEE3098598.1 hypothetical protein [Pseudomonadota bacterium]